MWVGILAKGIAGKGVRVGVKVWAGCKEGLGARAREGV